MSLRRRSFLKNLALGASAGLLGPIARQLDAHASGESPSKRVVFVVEGNGMGEGNVIPTHVVEALQELTQKGRAAGKTYDIESPLIVGGLRAGGARALGPLADAGLLEHTAVVSGMSYHTAGKGHSSNYGALSNQPGKEPIGPSIDQYLAGLSPQKRPFPHVAMGMVGSRGPTPPQLVYATTSPGAGKRTPVLTSPVIQRRVLFGSVAGGAGMSEFDMRTNMLDFMTGDIQRFQRNLAGEELLKLEHYLHSVESLRHRQTKLVELRTSLSESLPPESDIYTSPHPIHRLEATFELAAAALVSGLTEHMLITSGTSNVHFGVKFTSFGEEFPGKHGLGHGASYMGMNSGYWLGEIHRRHVAMIASLATMLKSVPEGDGTMWDNTLVVYLNDAGNAHHNRNESWPVVLLGGSNIGLELDGRAILYPREGMDGHRHLGALWNTLCHAFGDANDSFGADPSPMAMGPLSELLR